MNTKNDSGRIIIFDTTLRDGEQSPGAAMTLEEKIEVAEMLDAMGVDIIEAGFPIASAGDYDAVHLSVAGYLATAGRALRAGEWHTVLAGWNPDETWWLTVTPRRVEPAVRWAATGDSEPFAWTRSAA